MKHTLTKPVDLTGQIVLADNAAPNSLGTSSFVYKGYLRRELVAIKVLRRASDDSPPMHKEIIREGEIWASLDHPNVVPLHGIAHNFGEFGALISPWYPAGDADTFLKEKGASISFRDRIVLWKTVVTGVNYLHTRTPPLVHGDLKPPNILIDSSGTPKICDFGLARNTIDDKFCSIAMGEDITHTGALRYRSIELLTSEENPMPTTASDIHALGCLGLEFLFTRKPHEQRKHNFYGYLSQDIMNGIPPARRPDDLSPLQRAAWDILEPCWNLNPGLRPAASDILRQIEALLAPTKDALLSRRTQKSSDKEIPWMDQAARLSIQLVDMQSTRNPASLGGYWRIASNLLLEMELSGLAFYTNEVGKVVRESVKQWATSLNPLLLLQPSLWLE